MHRFDAAIHSHRQPEIKKTRSDAFPLLPREKVQMNMSRVRSDYVLRRSFRMEDHSDATIVWSPLVLLIVFGIRIDVP
jgi:hypothetical protein